MSDVSRSPEFSPPGMLFDAHKDDGSDAMERFERRRKKTEELKEGKRDGRGRKKRQEEVVDTELVDNNVGRGVGRVVSESDGGSPTAMQDAWNRANGGKTDDVEVAESLGAHLQGAHTELNEDGFNYQSEEKDPGKAMVVAGRVVDQTPRRDEIDGHMSGAAARERLKEEYEEQKRETRGVGADEGGQADTVIIDGEYTVLPDDGNSGRTNVPIIEITTPSTSDEGRADTDAQAAARRFAQAERERKEREQSARENAEAVRRAAEAGSVPRPVPTYVEARTEGERRAAIMYEFLKRSTAERRRFYRGELEKLRMEGYDISALEEQPDQPVEPEPVVRVEPEVEIDPWVAKINALLDDPLYTTEEDRLRALGRIGNDIRKALERNGTAVSGAAIERYKAMVDIIKKRKLESEGVEIFTLDDLRRRFSEMALDAMYKTGGAGTLFLDGAVLGGLEAELRKKTDRTLMDDEKVRAEINALITMFNAVRALDHLRATKAYGSVLAKKDEDPTRKNQMAVDYLNAAFKDSVIKAILDVPDSDNCKKENISKALKVLVVSGRRARSAGNEDNLGSFERSLRDRAKDGWPETVNDIFEQVFRLSGGNVSKLEIVKAKMLYDLMYGAEYDQNNPFFILAHTREAASKVPSEKWGGSEFLRLSVVGDGQIPLDSNGFSVIDTVRQRVFANTSGGSGVPERLYTSSGEIDDINEGVEKGSGVDKVLAMVSGGVESQIQKKWGDVAVAQKLWNRMLEVNGKLNGSEISAKKLGEIRTDVVSLIKKGEITPQQGLVILERMGRVCLLEISLINPAAGNKEGSDYRAKSPYWIYDNLFAQGMAERRVEWGNAGYFELEGVSERDALGVLDRLSLFGEQMARAYDSSPLKSEIVDEKQKNRNRKVLGYFPKTFNSYDVNKRRIDEKVVDLGGAVETYGNRVIGVGDSGVTGMVSDVVIATEKAVRNKGILGRLFSRYLEGFIPNSRKSR